MREAAPGVWVPDPGDSGLVLPAAVTRMRRREADEAAAAEVERVRAEQAAAAARPFDEPMILRNRATRRAEERAARKAAKRAARRAPRPEDLAPPPGPSW